MNHEYRPDNGNHQRHVRPFRDTMVCINIQGSLAIVLWMPMMAGTQTP